MIEHSWNRAGRVSALVLLLLVAALPTALADEASGADAEAPQVLRGKSTIQRVTPIRFDIDVRNLPTVRNWQPGDPIIEIPKRKYPKPGAPVIVPDESPDPLAGRQLNYTDTRRGSESFPTPTRNFQGIGLTGAGVPDTVGDVGLNHYIQSTNGGTRVRIYNKNLPNPTLLAEFNIDDFSTGVCGTGGGDPVVIYDREADRWVIMEFPAFGVSSLCVLVSQTPDPVSGGWFFYEFDVPSFPDYEKFGVWPTDANGGPGTYVTTANAGVAVYALERGPMLTGGAAGLQIFNLPGLAAFAFESVTPADIDGPDLPPATAPGIVMRQRDTEAHGGGGGAGDLLEMWAFDVDWDSPGQTTLTQMPSIGVADFSSELCGFVAFACFPQPNSSTTLDPLREVIMHRLQYMNHASDGYETLVGNYVIDVDGANQGGIRWFELRRTGGVSQPWTLFQEGTYTIDSDTRWMGASSMDQSGNIALAYNVSSTSTFPSLRYTGRRASDPLGIMSQPETEIGTGTNPSGTNRYGDYAAMGLDPADDCTFWFTGMYNPAGSWRTRIASFRFQDCGCLTAPSPVQPAVELNGFNSVSLTWDDSDLSSVVAYDVLRARNPGGPYETIATVGDTSLDFAGGPGYSFVDDTVSGNIVYFYAIEASDGGPCRSELQEAEIEATGICNLRPVFDGIADASLNVADTCGINVSWNAAAAECGTDVTYNLYRSTDPGFTPGPDNLLSGGITGTSLLDLNELVGGVEYFYTVRAQDTGNLLEDLNVAKDGVTAGGSGGLEDFYSFDFEDAAEFAAEWTVTTGPGLHRCGEFELAQTPNERPDGGSGQYALALSEDCATLLPATSTTLFSPVFDTSSGSFLNITLDVDVFYNHFNGDDATIEVWDGNQWVVIWTDPNADVDERLSFNVTAFALGNDAFQVRFNYQNANDDRWYAVDNIRLGIDLNCVTAATPSPAPDGAGDTGPLRGELLSPDGSALRVIWDAASCPSNGYNLLAGDLTNVSTYAFSDSECGIGNGTFDWNDVPATSTFFLIVGNDGADTESSWGQSTFGERNGLTPSGLCGATQKTVAATCPAN